ncbi:MAG TPA: HAMP domain-containing sensor histidine kinase [Holophagaceae bacterium]|jgi:signal transduction histidine kinase|nr:HAMP domain-containing sensor histidine kinase [Holophagaceae bacterium]
MAVSPLAVGAAVAIAAWLTLPRLPGRWGEICFATLLGLGLGWAGLACLRRAQWADATAVSAWRWTGLALFVTALSNLLTGPVILLGASGVLPTAGARMWAATFGNSLEVISRLLLIVGLTTWPSERPGALARVQRGLGGLIVSGSLLFVLLTAMPGLLDAFINLRGPYGPVNLTFLLDLLSVVAALAVLLPASVDLSDTFAPSLRPLPTALLVYLGILLIQNGLVMGLHAYHWDGLTAWPLLTATGLLAYAGTTRGNLAPREAHEPWIRPGFLALPVGVALVWGAWLALERPETVHPLGRAIGIAVGTLVLLRLYLTQRELQTFNHRLEGKVAERTKALEESVSAMLKTQRLNMVATLGAGLAHDFRNLLTVILGSSELMMLRQETGQPMDRRDLESIRDAASRGRDLAQQLMALGRQSDHPQAVAFDLAQQVETFMPLLERMVPSTVKVLMEGTRAPLPIRSDPRQIEQILVNLVANARDALPKGGRIHIRTSCVETDSGPWARIQVEDDGTGMEPAVLDRIFDPFYTTKAPGLGTGLGLASVKAIVESWGGRLLATSSPGQGSLFTVDLKVSDRNSS